MHNSFLFQRQIEAKLIALVEGYSHIYDKKSNSYKDSLMKENSWVAISKELRMSSKLDPI